MLIKSGSTRGNSLGKKSHHPSAAWWFGTGELEMETRTRMLTHTCTGALAHTYKYSVYTQYPIEQILLLLFGISLTNIMPHQNVAKSNVLEKK